MWKLGVRVGEWSIALLSALAAPSSFAQCPVNSGRMCNCGCPQPLSSLPIYSVSGGGCVGGYGGVSYDLTRGHLEAYASSIDPHLGSVTQMTTTDLFLIVGPASPSPISVAIRVHVVHNQAEFRVFSDAARDSSKNFLGNSPADLRISFAIGVGVEFPVSMFVSVAVLSYGFGSGDMFFEALPPGYSVASCQGFANAPVPTRKVAWGMLKAHYR